MAVTVRGIYTSAHDNRVLKLFKNRYTTKQICVFISVLLNNYCVPTTTHTCASET
jgi:hypothetical protein